MKRKRAIIVWMLAMVSFAVSGCDKVQKDAVTELTKEDVETICFLNDNSAIGIDLARELPANASNFETLFTDDGLVKAHAFAYLEDGAPLKVSEVSITGAGHDVLGVEVGKAYEASKETLTANGFSFLGEDDFRDEKRATFQKGNVYVNVRYNPKDDVITNIGLKIFFSMDYTYPLGEE